MCLYSDTTEAKTATFSVRSEKQHLQWTALLFDWLDRDMAAKAASHQDTDQKFIQ